MNFVCVAFELCDKMLTLSSMENLIVPCNHKVTACIDRVRNLRWKLALRCSNLFIVYLCFNVLVRAIFLIVALLNNVKVVERFESFPGSKIGKKTYKISKNK